MEQKILTEAEISVEMDSLNTSISNAQGHDKDALITQFVELVNLSERSGYNVMVEKIEGAKSSEEIYESEIDEICTECWDPDCPGCND